MMRPKLRPTLSRKTKYWGITPTAHRKLNKEARRGSHDLRRLVGHANFLDVLIDELDVDQENEEEQKAVSPVQEEPPTEEVEELVEDNTESDSEEWSDDDDDEDHSLFRTMSKRPDDHNNEAYDNVRISPSEDGGDYFQHARHGEVEAISPSNAAGLGPNDDKDGAINVTVTNSLIELMDNLGHEVQEDDGSALKSPIEQTLVEARQSVADAIKDVDVPN